MESGRLGVMAITPGRAGERTRGRPSTRKNRGLRSTRRVSRLLELARVLERYEQKAGQTPLEIPKYVGHLVGRPCHLDRRRRTNTLLLRDKVAGAIPVSPRTSQPLWVG